MIKVIIEIIRAGIIPKVRKFNKIITE